MKSGADNRKKTILAISLGAVALGCIVYMLITLFGGSSDSAPAPQPAAKTETSGTTSTATAKTTQSSAGTSLGAIPGVDAQKLASTSASLDPTLDETAMLRTESLVYSGSGRNIFSVASEPVAMPILPATVPNPHNKTPIVAPQPPRLPQTCPPSCPPINLRFFGTAQRGNLRQAFLLQGEDVYLASPGDIVAHKYKILSVAANSIQVQDLSNGNTQMLPLQQ